MALSDLMVVGSTHQSVNNNVKKPYVAHLDIDFADALAAKGSALVATDVIPAIYLPAGTVVLDAGIKLIEPANSTTLTVDLGHSAGNPDDFVDGFDAQGSAAGSYAARDAAAAIVGASNAAASMDVTLATLTGTLSSGVIRVWALIVDVDSIPETPGIVQVGS